MQKSSSLVPVNSSLGQSCAQEKNPNEPRIPGCGPGVLRSGTVAVCKGQAIPHGDRRGCLHLAGCLAASLASSHQLPVAPLSQVVTIKTVPMWPNIPEGADGGKGKITLSWCGFNPPVFHGQLQRAPLAPQSALGVMGWGASG